MPQKGRFIVVDGLDGIGKSIFLNTLKEESEQRGKKVLDIEPFWKEYNNYPALDDIIGNYHAVLTCEPTFCGVGRIIREELIQKEKNYSVQLIAKAFAADRQKLYQKLILPLLKSGIDIYQSRSLATSLVFQRQTALNQGQTLTMEDILQIPGNAFCYRHPMDFLIIPTIDTVEEVIKRLTERKDKVDNCIFETFEFQRKLKEVYESAGFQNIFERNGTTIIYMDAGKTIEFSRQQMRNFYKEYLD